jgi:hypothetical protein
MASPKIGLQGFPERRFTRIAVKYAQTWLIPDVAGRSVEFFMLDAYGNSNKTIACFCAQFHANTAI